MRLAAARMLHRLTDQESGLEYAIRGEHDQGQMHPDGVPDREAGH